MVYREVCNSMKKIIIPTVIVILIILIGSGLIESSYCRQLISATPLNVSPGEEYSHGGTFCEINTLLAIPAMFVAYVIGNLDNLSIRDFFI